MRRQPARKRAAEPGHQRPRRHAGGRQLTSRRATHLDRRRSRPPTCSRAICALSVTDNGTGMPAEVMARAFDPFFTTKPRARAPGSACRRSTVSRDQSGGRAIDRRASPGGYHVYVPDSAQSRRGGDATRPRRPQSSPAGEQETILLSRTIRMLRRRDSHVAGANRLSGGTADAERGAAEMAGNPCGHRRA